MGKPSTGKGRREDDAHARRQAIIDGLLADALRPAFHRPPSHDALPPDIRQAIDRLLAKAEAQRSRNLTYDDLEEALPPGTCRRKTWRRSSGSWPSTGSRWKTARPDAEARLPPVSRHSQV